MRRLSLDEVLQALPPLVLPLVESLVEAAAERGLALHLVGGPVRDLLLERPIRDVDLMVAAQEPERVFALARQVAPEGAKVVEHERFGTLAIEVGEARVDLACARRERYARPGALPEVEPGALEEDLLRRDFTVNALALPLAARGAGRRRRDETLELIDLVGGEADLSKRRLRVLHTRSFHDDPTRALRAARLAPRLGFSLSRGSRSSLRDALRDGAFGSVSGDRLRREIEKCFTDATLGLAPADALGRLAEWHVLPALEPGLSLPAAARHPLRRLGKAAAEPLWRGPRWRPWAAGLAVWLAPLPPELRRLVLRRLSLRGELAARIAVYPAARDGWLAALAKARGRGEVDAVLHGIDEERLSALCAEAPPAVRRRIVRWAAEDRARRAPLSGNDLLALGLRGPAVGTVLARIRSAFLDGGVANREEAIALARELARQGAPRKRKAGARKKRTVRQSGSAKPGSKAGRAPRRTPREANR